MLCSCTSRTSRTTRGLQQGPKYEPLTLRSIPHHTEAEHVLNQYERHYDQFRKVMKLGNLQIRDEATLARDYDEARRAFNEWLQFVTDTIEQQSDLEREGAPPEFRYSERANLAMAAIKKLDADLLKHGSTAEPQQTTDSRPIHQS